MNLKTEIGDTHPGWSGIVSVLETNRLRNRLLPKLVSVFDTTFALLATYALYPYYVHILFVIDVTHKFLSFKKAKRDAALMRLFLCLSVYWRLLRFSRLLLLRLSSASAAEAREAA